MCKFELTRQCKKNETPPQAERKAGQARRRRGEDSPRPQVEGVQKRRGEERRREERRREEKREREREKNREREREKTETEEKEREREGETTT